MFVWLLHGTVCWDIYPRDPCWCLFELRSCCPGSEWSQQNVCFYKSTNVYREKDWPQQSRAALLSVYYHPRAISQLTICLLLSDLCYLVLKPVSSVTMALWWERSLLGPMRSCKRSVWVCMERRTWSAAQRAPADTDLQDHTGTKIIKQKYFSE